MTAKTSSCLAHGIHLAATDILYQKQTRSIHEVPESEGEENKENNDDGEGEEDSRDSDGLEADMISHAPLFPSQLNKSLTK